MRSLLLFIFILSSFAVKSQYSIQLYNNTGKDVYFAIAYYDKDDKCFNSKGWYQIERYSSYTLSLGNYPGKIVFIRGERRNSVLSDSWGSGYSFCVDPTNSFTIKCAGTINCKKSKQFSKMEVHRGVNKWTFNP